MSHSIQYCTFRVGDFFMGVHVQEVQEVIKYHEVTPVNLANDAIAGLINIRGQIVPAIDLKKRLHLGEITNDKNIMNIVINSNEGPISLMINSVGNVLELINDDFEKPPNNFNPDMLELINGVYKLKDELLIIINTDKIINIKSKLELNKGQ